MNLLVLNVPENISVKLVDKSSVAGDPGLGKRRLLYRNYSERFLLTRDAYLAGIDTDRVTCDIRARLRTDKELRS